MLFCGGLCVAETKGDFKDVLHGFLSFFHYLRSLLIFMHDKYAKSRWKVVSKVSTA